MINYADWLHQRRAPHPLPDDNFYAGLLEQLSPHPDADDLILLRQADVLVVKTASHPLLPSRIPDQLGDEVAELLDGLTASPWKSGDHIALATWLDELKPALDRLVATASRADSYRPLISETSEFILSFGFPEISAARLSAKLLGARAMRSLANGQAAIARSDLLAIHRMGHHLGQANSMIELLIAYAVDSIAYHSSAIWMTHKSVTSDDREEFLSTLAGLKPFHRMADTVVGAEQACGLDCLQRIFSSDPKIAATARKSFLEPSLFSELSDSWIPTRRVVFETMRWRANFDELRKDLEDRYRHLSQLCTAPASSYRSESLTKYLDGISPFQTWSEELLFVGKLCFTSTARRNQLLCDFFFSEFVVTLPMALSAEVRHDAYSSLILLLKEAVDHREKTGNWPTAIKELPSAQLLQSKIALGTYAVSNTPDEFIVTLEGWNGAEEAPISEVEETPEEQEIRLRINRVTLEVPALS